MKSAWCLNKYIYTISILLDFYIQCACCQSSVCSFEAQVSVSALPPFVKLQGIQLGVGEIGLVLSKKVFFYDQ